MCGGIRLQVDMRSPYIETLQRHSNVISRVALLLDFLTVIIVNSYMKDVFVPIGLLYSVFS